MTIKELVNTCQLLWGEGLFIQNKNFRVIITEKKSTKEYNPWSNKYFKENHNKKVDY